MKNNSILDITAVCIGLILTGYPVIIVFYVVSEIADGLVRKPGLVITGLILLSICASVSVGIRLGMEIIVDRITAAFPTMSSATFMGTQLLLMFGFLLLLVCLALRILHDDGYLVIACLWFAFTYGTHSKILGTYSS